MDGDDPSPRVLMYHKVNDLPNSPMSMPSALRRADGAAEGASATRVVDLDAVLAHYGQGVALPQGVVLITFHDDYRDTSLKPRRR